MANNRINYSIGFNVEQTELNRLKTALQELQRMTTKDFARINFDTKDAEGDLAKVKASVQELQTALNKSTNLDLGTVNLAKFNKELKNMDLQSIYKNLSLAGSAGTSAFRNLTTGLLQTNVKIKQSNKLLDDMANTMKNTAKWGIASSVMNSFTNSVQQAYGYVKHLDSSLNDIRIVTGYSADEMDRFAEKANKAAKNLAASTTDYTEAALIYYQQGLSGDEVEKRAETTLKTANVTGQSAQEVSEQLTAVWNGYKVSAAETEMYVDKLAAVAASTASDLEELSTGMSKVASAASASGVDMDQLSATLSTVISVTRQAPESVGTAFKTIYARLGDLAVDGEDEFGTKLGEVSNKLKTMGIDILDSQGQMREMGTVVEEVAAKWDTWSSAQKQAAAVAMAGKRQYNNLIALFENWDMYEDALQTSQNSLGTLSEQQEIYLDSAEAKLQQLKTSQEGLYDSLLDADTIKEVAGLLTGLVSGLEHVVDSIGGGSTVLLGLGAAFTKVFNKQLTSSLVTTAMNFKTMNQNVSNLKNSAQMVEHLKTELTSIGDTADKATVEIVNMYSELLKTSGVLSQEDMQEFEQVIKDFNEAAEAADRYSTAKAKAGSSMYALTDEGIDDEWKQLEGEAASGKEQGKTVEQIKESSQLYQHYSQQLEEAEGRIKAQTKAFQTQKNEIQKITAEIEESGAASEEQKANIQAIRNEWIKAAQKVADEPLLEGSEVKTELQEIIAQMQDLEGEVNASSEEIEKQFKQCFENAVNAAKVELSEMDQALDQAISGQGALIQERMQQARGAMEGQAEKIDMTQTMQGLTDVLGAVEMGVFGVTAAWNGLSALWNKDLTIGQRLGQAFTGILTGTTMLIPSVIQLGNAYKAGTFEKLKSLAVDVKQQAAEKISVATKTAAAVAEKIKAVATGQATVATVANTTAVKANTAALLANPYVLAAAAIIGLVSGVILLTKAFKNNTSEVDKAKEATEAARKEFEETQNEINDINTALDGWKSAADGLKDLEKGTAAWKQQLIEANNQVLQLLETYPQLAQYVTTDEDGLMQISQDGLDMIQEENTRKLEAAQVQYSTAQAYEANAKKDQLVSDTAVSTNINSSALEKIMNYGAENGASFMQNEESIKAALDEMGLAPSYARLIMKHSDELATAIGEAAAYATQAELHTDTVLDSVMNQVDGYAELTSEEQKLARDKLKDAGWDDKFEQNYATREAQGDRKIRNQYADQIGATDWQKNDDGEIEYLIDGVWTAIDDTTARMELASADTAKSFEGLTSDAIEAAKALAGLKDEALTHNSTQVGAREAMSENEASAIAAGTKTDGIDLSQLSDAELGNLRMGTGGKESNNYEFSDDQVEAAGFEATEQGYKDYVNWLNEQANKELAERKEQFALDAEDNAENLNEDYNVTDTEGNQITASSDNFTDAGFTSEDMDNWGEISGYIDENIVATQGWTEALKQAKEQYQEINAEAEFSSSTEALGEQYSQDYGIDAEEYEQMAEYLHEYGDELEGVSEDIEGNAEASQELAKEMLRYDKAVESVKENSEDWMDILESGNIQDQAAIMDELSDAYGNMLDIDGGQLSKDFLQNAENLKLMEEAANGSTEAYEQLMDAAQLDLENQKFSIDPTIDTEKFYEEKAAFEAGLQAMNFDDLEVGAKINDQDALNAMSNLVNAAHMTATEAQNYLASMGVDAEVEEVTVDSEDDHQYTGANAQVTEEKVTGNDPVTGDEVEYNFPSVEYKKTPPVKGKNKKKTTATALKVTAASKSSGGGFKHKNSSSGSGSKSGGGGGGGGGGSTPKRTVKKSEKKFDRYRKVNNNLSKLSTEMERLTKAQDKLFGKDLLNNLNKQLDVLKKQVTQTKKKLALAKAEAKEMRTKREKNYKDENGYVVKNDLKDFGIKFNDKGEITNYKAKMQWYDNEIAEKEARWNAMSAKEQEKNKSLGNRIEALKNNRDVLEKLVKDYDTLIYDTIPGLQDEVTELAYAQIEIKLKKFNLEAELRLDLTEAIKQWDDFRKELAEYDHYEEGDLQSRMNTLTDTSAINKETISRLTTSGLTETLTGDVNEMVAEIQDVRANPKTYDGQFASRDAKGNILKDDNGNVIIDEQAMWDSLDTSMEELQQHILDVKEAEKQAFDDLMEGIDMVGEAYDAQFETLDFIASQLDHNMAMIELVAGDMAHLDINEDTGLSKMEEMYAAMADNAQQTADTAKEAMDYYASQMNDPNLTEAEREKFRQMYQEAADDYQAALAQQAEIAQKQFEATVQKEIALLKKEMNFDKTSAQWELEMEMDDDYLDEVNTAFERQSFINKVQKSINDTESLSAQKRLNKLRDEELEKLKKKDKLTQYDLDRANQMLEIELKKIALEEAQQNKSQMRLRRDSSGNYSYQFVADEDSQTEAQEELAQAQNDLYNMDKEELQARNQELLDIQQQFYESLAEWSQLSVEERAAREDEFTAKWDYYKRRQTELAGESTWIQENLAQSTYGSMATLYQMDESNFSHLTEAQKKMLGDKNKTYKTLSAEEQRIVKEEMVPTWTHALDDMIDKINNTDPETGFEAAWNNAVKNIQTANTNCATKLKDLKTQANTTYNDAKTKANDWLKKQKDLTKELKDKTLPALRDTYNAVKDIAEQWQEAYDNAMDALEAAQDYKEQVLKEEADDVGGGNGGGNGDSGGNNDQDTVGDHDGNKKATLTEKRKKGIAAAIVYRSGYGGWKTDPTRKARLKEIFGMAGRNKVQSYINTHWSKVQSGKTNPIKTFYNNNKKAAAYTYEKAKKFDTGGYTGQGWSAKDKAQGKLAILHEKELVLNAKDTDKMLDMIKMVRKLSGQSRDLDKALAAEKNQLKKEKKQLADAQAKEKAAKTAKAKADAAKKAADARKRDEDKKLAAANKGGKKGGSGRKVSSTAAANAAKATNNLKKAAEKTDKAQQAVKATNKQIDKLKKQQDNVDKEMQTYLTSLKKELDSMNKGKKLDANEKALSKNVNTALNKLKDGKSLTDKEITAITGGLEKQKANINKEQKAVEKELASLTEKFDDAVKKEATTQLQNNYETSLEEYKNSVATYEDMVASLQNQVAELQAQITAQQENSLGINSFEDFIKAISTAMNTIDPIGSGTVATTKEEPPKVEIFADFPNAVYADEIQKAFENLILVASQEAQTTSK